MVDVEVGSGWYPLFGAVAVNLLTDILSVLSFSPLCMTIYIYVSSCHLNLTFPKFLDVGFSFQTLNFLSCICAFQHKGF